MRELLSTDDDVNAVSGLFYLDRNKIYFYFLMVLIT